MWQTIKMVNHFTRLTSSTYTLSSVDKKGRIFIPVKLRFKLRFLEGTKVKLTANGNKLVVEKGGSE
ncbi:MAG: AbrB/MazE/SpoVT family DNA-binding domain-containing protein [Candidatus Aenigmarchaeota archaeon]|nr:AbrB/MazE/SpoVT family DNA-binding domain-containing protein [Candidatus Aenigmarchaeota archaeon]